MAANTPAGPPKAATAKIVLGVLAAVVGGVAGAGLLTGGTLPAGVQSAFGLASPAQTGPQTGFQTAPQTGARTGRPDGAGAGDPALSQADQQLEAKLQPYVRCINGVERELDALRSRYRNELEYVRLVLAGKPPMMSPNITGLRLTLDGYSGGTDRGGECAAGLEQAAAQAPAIPELDQAGQDYARALRAMLPVFPEAQRYYEQKDWKDDRFAKGTALDAKLRPAFADSERAGAAIRAALRGQENGLRTRQLAAVEARDGRTARWQGLNFMLRARELENEAGRQAASGSFSAKALQLGIEQLSAAWDEANSYAAAHPDEMARSGGQQRPIWARISQPASSYLASAKELRRAVEADQRKSDTLRSAYNSMVRDFNTVVDAFNAQY